MKKIEIDFSQHKKYNLYIVIKYDRQDIGRNYAAPHHQREKPVIMVCEAGQVIYRFGKRDVFWDVYVEETLRSVENIWMPSIPGFGNKWSNWGQRHGTSTNT